MKKRLLTLCLVAVLAMSVVMPVRAAPRTAVINVAYGITLMFNEQEAYLTDANGKRVEPFVSNGTTYVPIRAVSELFGADVRYDANTNTAYVYDDFSELCAVINKMEQIMTDCYLLASDELHQNPQSGFGDFTNRYNLCAAEANIMQEALRKIQKSNTQWEILKTEILPYYQEVIMQTLTVENAYRAMRANFNTVSVATFGNAVLQQTDNYNAARNADNV